jgi:hypothetical protein
MSKLKEFEVSVEKQQYCTGVIKVKAANAEAAQTIIQTQIDLGKLQTTSVEWFDDPEYIDGSFKTTGDIEEA